MVRTIWRGLYNLLPPDYSVFWWIVIDQCWNLVWKQLPLGMVEHWFLPFRFGHLSGEPVGIPLVTHGAREALMPFLCGVWCSRSERISANDGHCCFKVMKAMKALKDSWTPRNGWVLSYYVVLLFLGLKPETWEAPCLQRWWLYSFLRFRLALKAPAFWGKCMLCEISAAKRSAWIFQILSKDQTYW